MKMLLVDEHSDYSDALAHSLQGQCDVEFACDGRQALARAETFWPDVVVIDLQMPGMDGFETVRAMREQAWSKGATFVAHSATIAVTPVEALKAGFHFFVPKDSFAVLRISSILNAVRRVIEVSPDRVVNVLKDVD